MKPSPEPRYGKPETVLMNPCPFCGEKDIDAEMAKSSDGDVAAGCMVCGASGPIAHTPQDAALQWNARSKSSKKEK